ncbi:MAG: hypothetical protein IIY70_01860, partial [Oscillospiraceae bacterium]|nr:hypothetical protein [Oscillospiraceae bacterium]
MPFKQQQTEYSVPKLIRRLLLSWIFAFTLEFFLLPASLRDLSGLKGLAGMSLPRILIVTLAGLAVLTAAEYLGRGKHATSRQGQLQVERWAMVGLLLVNVVLSLLASFTWAFLGGCALLLGIAAVYARRGWQNVPPPQPIRQTESKRWLRLLVGGSLAFFLFDSLWMLARIRSFGTPSYD